MGAVPEYMLTRQSAWHRIGNVLGSFFDIETLLADSDLNRQVVKRQLEFKGNLIPAWGTFYEDNDQFISVVGEDYQVLQHTEGFTILNSLIGNGVTKFETAGTMFDGAVVFASAALDKSIAVGDDESKVFLNFITSHNGKYAFMVRASMIRLVCQNTLEASLGESTRAGFKVYHTKNAVVEFNDAKKAIQSVGSDLELMEKQLNFLATKMVTSNGVKEVFQKLFPQKEQKSKSGQTRFEKKIEAIYDRFESNDGNAFPNQRGTAYNLLNAITGYVDHDKSNLRPEYATVGQGNDLKTRALEIITLAADGMPSKVETTYVDMNRAAVEELLFA